LTAAQKREQARVEYDGFCRTCPTNELLGRLSDKWVSLVVAALSDGPRRHGELSRKIAGVSPKMLTQAAAAEAEAAEFLERENAVGKVVQDVLDPVGLGAVFGVGRLPPRPGALEGDTAASEHAA
jgi:DNA-binding HxlR family transcriptional regulator